MNRNIGRLDRTRFSEAHAGTVYVQPVFPNLPVDDIRRDTFAYPPCWAILDPGMAVETHRHEMPEFYVFVKGGGRMTLGTDRFDVAAGMGVNIPGNVDHSVENLASSVGPLVWVSIGLEGETA